MAAAPKLVAARTQFSAEIDGEHVVVLVGARFRADHPLVKANPGLFAPVRR